MILAAFVYTELLKKLVVKKKVKEQAEILIHRVKMIKRWSNYSLKSPKPTMRPPVGLVAVSLRWETEERVWISASKNRFPCMGDAEELGLHLVAVLSRAAGSPGRLGCCCCLQKTRRGSDGSAQPGAHNLPNIVFLIHFKYCSSALIELCCFRALITV